MKIIDVHGHYGSWPFVAYPETPDRIRQVMNRYDIALCIVSSALAVTYDFRQGNREVAGLLETEPGLRGYVVVNPNYLEESVQEAEHYLPLPHFVGFKMHCVYTEAAINDTRALRLLQELAQFEVPWLVHVPAGQLAGLADAARRFPTTTFVLAHMGGAAWHQGIQIACEIPNVYLELNSGFAEMDRVGEAVAAVGAERVLFGSDLTLHDPGFVLGLVYDADLTEDQRRAILHDNAVRLFDLHTGDDSTEGL